MIVHDMRQGSEEWHMVRLGKPTASQFHRIITPKTLKPSGQREDYMAELVAEVLTGAPLESGDSLFMNRGNDMEAEAVSWYELTHGVDVELVGFCEDHGVGGSPDGLVHPDGLIEVKCRNQKNHTKALMSDAHGAQETQIQGLLYVTGRKWVDVIHYNPKIPNKVHRVERDADYIAALSAAVLGFAADLAEAVATLSAASAPK